jgi:hypothetical protein
MSTDAAPDPGSDLSDGTIVAVFEDHHERGLSTNDVVSALPFDREVVYERLLELAGEGVVARERVPGWETIWWLVDAPDGLDAASLDDR